MKQTMIDAMTQMMPYIMPAAYAGAALLALGIVALLFWFFSGWGTGLLRLTGRLAILLGLFFLASQVAGAYLQMQPELNLGDAAKFEFNTVAFWIVGLVFLILGLVLRIFGSFRPTH